MPAWHTFYVLGAFAAYFVLMHLARRVPSLDSLLISRMYVFCYLGGYLGARFFSIIVEEDVAGIGDFFAKLFSLGAMTFYGGAIGSFLIGAVYVVYNKIDLKDVVDISFPAGVAALAIGRVGCFLNGDDFGIPTTLQGELSPWYGVVFPNLEDGITRYPVQLMSTLIAGGMALFFILNFDRIRKKLGSGWVGCLCVLSYAIARFCIEFFRGDPRGSIFEGMLSTSQAVSILIAAVCADYSCKNILEVEKVFETTRMTK